MIETSRKLAADCLEISPDATAAVVQSAFLKQLANSNFVPPEASLAAMTRLRGDCLPLSPDAVAQLGDYDKGDVEEFLQHYWKTDPSERQRQWHILADRCRDVEARSTLTRVQEGLSLSVIPHEDDSLQELAVMIREWYLLPPGQRAQRRLEWCAKQTSGPLLASKASRFLDRDAKTAALEPQLFEQLLATKSIIREHEPLSDDARAKLAEKELQRVLALHQTVAEQNGPPPVPSAGCGSSFGGWAIAVFLLALVRGCISLTTQTTPPQPQYDPPRYLPSNPKWQAPPQPKKTETEGKIDQAIQDAFNAKKTYPKLVTPRFTPQQIKEFSEYDPSSGKDPPVGYIPYVNWLLNGKPEASKTPPAPNRQPLAPRDP